MAPPKFKRPTSSTPKEWTNAELDQLAVRVTACEDFCEAANDWMHEEGEPESEEESVLREILLKKLTGGAKPSTDGE